MKIDLSRIYPNPHRDLARNPVNQDQVQAVAESIQRTGFWDNVVVREKDDSYELAYGHNRYAALQQIGITEADFIVKPLSDYDMLSAMIDENATQQKITPKIIFENVDAAIRLAEQMLSECDTVEQFNEAAKTSRSVPGQNVKKMWRELEFAKAKQCIGENGEGLGTGFVRQFLPGHAPTESTLQAVIDSHYADRRKAVAKRKAEEAQAEADRLEREAEEAQQVAETATDVQVKDRATKRVTKRKNQAKKAKQTAAKETQKAERIDTVGFARDLLERLEHPALMQEIVQLARQEKIPSEYHERLIQACLDEGWTAARNDLNRPHGVKNAGKVWWFKASGKAEKVRKEAKRENLKWKHREKSLDEFTRETLTDVKELIKALDAIKPFGDQIKNQKLIQSFDVHLVTLIFAANAVRGNLPRSENVVSIDLKRLEDGNA
jgi:hypothetical protein